MMWNFFTALGYLWFWSMVIKVSFKLFRVYWVHFSRGLCKNEKSLVENYGSWAVVTGSTDGIGKAYARELAKRGMNIVLVSRTKEKLEKVAAEIRSDFQIETKIVVADFRDGPPVYEHIQNELKNIPVGILVNNVAIFMEHPKYFDQLSPQYLWDVIHVNMATTWLMTNMILPSMKKQKKGAIVNLSSFLEIVPCPLSSNYSATKAFLRNFTLALQNECRSDGIRVQLISPAFLKTNLTKFSNYVHGFHDFFIPDAETFARHAVTTLTTSEHTTGYWPHDLWYWITNTMPVWLRTYLAGILAKFMLLEHIQLTPSNKKKSSYLPLQFSLLRKLLFGSIRITDPAGDVQS